MCLFIGKRDNLKKLLLYHLELFLHLSSYGFTCTICGLKYKNVSQCYCSSKQYMMYDGRRGGNFEPVHGPNRFQANLEYRSISLGAKTDPPNLCFHIQIYPAHCKPLLKLHGGLNLEKTLFSFQLCRSSGLSCLTYSLTHISIIPVVH